MEIDREAILEELAKIASLTGRDLRTPFVGMTTNFPTKDSAAYSRGLLQQSQSNTQPKTPKGPSIQDLAPKMPSTKGSLPKIGAVMINERDPLIQYLRKQAQVMEDNADNMPSPETEPELASEDPMPGDKMVKDFHSEHNAYLSRLFDNKGFRGKYDEKMK